MIETPDPYNKFLERYEAGSVPWDDPLPPPEIQALAMDLPPGKALDLGCGYGRVAIYLARRGWSADGIDFVPQAVEIARQRAAAAGVAELARFHVASAAELDFLDPPYDLAIDIGCMHSFSEELLRGYRRELERLLATGGRYVLFARLRDGEAVDGEGPRGIAEATINELLRDGFHLEHKEHGVSQMGDQPPWNSAWFWFRRR